MEDDMTRYINASVRYVETLIPFTLGVLYTMKAQDRDHGSNLFFV